MSPPAPVPGSAETAAAAALARGDALRALSIVGRAEAGLGVILKGIAYAQLGDLALAKRSLSRALRSASTPPLDRARARAALVEVALASGDAAEAARAAEASAAELERLGDARNASMQRLVQARAEVLLGNLGKARDLVEGVAEAASGAAAKRDGGRGKKGGLLPGQAGSAAGAAHDLRAVALLASAEIAVRALRALEARGALSRARAALEAHPNPLLARELVALETELSRPLARLETRGAVRTADLFAVEDASSGVVMLVDTCRRLAIAGRATVPFAKRPVLFALLVVLARAWPGHAARDVLVREAFGARKVNDSHRSRLRVEIGRLRAALDGLAEPAASGEGYALSCTRDVVVLLPRDDGDDTSRLALLLGDGPTWTAQALAEHAGVSKRTAQRALATLVESGAVVRIGEAREARYARSGPRIASRMLLLGLFPKT